jgi:multicomponent Na+:H+ antiporter subunit D
MASVTFLSIYSKIRVFFFLYVLTTGFLHFSSDLLTIFFIFCGILSIFVGRVGAFTEKRIKRFFVFSSRGHVGFILLGFSLSTYEGLTSVFHYVPVYRLTSFLR